MIVEKQVFKLRHFTFEAGISMPIEVGYETYGTLNSDKSNAILLCHFFSGNSHAAGRYASQPEDAEPGWWDGLVGPGKAFDTDRYFIICSDVLCNVSPYSTAVITTGPATTSPVTGEKYGLSFPQVTIRDFVKVQKGLVASFGIETLHCVAGPSMGGMQALQWAVDYPDAMKKVISVISGPRMPAYTGIIPLQIGVDAIRMSPEAGLKLAVKMMTLQNRNFENISELWGHPLPITGPGTGWDWGQQPHQYFQDLDDLVESRIHDVDPQHWLYMTRANQLFNIEAGYASFDDALSRIQAEVLAVPVSSDLMLPPEESRDMIERLKKLGKKAHYYEVVTDGGHISAITEYEKFVEPIKQFLDKE